MTTSITVLIAFVVVGALEVTFLLRALLRPNRDPSSRVAWVLIILSLPAVGMIGYILFGEARLSPRRTRRYRANEPHLTLAAPDSPYDPVPIRHRHLFRAGASVNGFAPVTCNTARIMDDSNAGIDAIVADIDAATDHVHLLFYIWLEDINGLKVTEAVKRAARRGVTVRAMADDLGSRKMTRSRHWSDMAEAGVHLARALPLRNPLLHPFRGRIDLRNHRKIVVIDNRITYCGSQNCADPEFLVKARFAPWVDLLARFEGPIARQNQTLFLQDWMAHVDEDLRALPTAPDPVPQTGTVIAQAIGTGPTIRASAMPEMFESLFHAARSELILTTPYFVPTEAMQAALRAAAHRGVHTRIVFPARNDSWIVAAASRSYYLDLLKAGVRIFEYSGGLLHAKSLTLDGEVAMIGSANLDRRSFELNFENNILLYDTDLTASLIARQEAYIAASAEVTVQDVMAWPIHRRLWNNTVAMMGPIL